MSFMWNPPYKQNADTFREGPPIAKTKEVLSLTRPPPPSHLPREKMQTREQSAA